MPTLSVLLTGFATRLTDLENYETEDGMCPWIGRIVKAKNFQHMKRLSSRKFSS
jgi:hypothetical protein